MTREDFVKEHPIEVELQRRGVQLAKKNGSLMALCPFHEDKNPSMSVSVEKGLFKCFGCNASGSVIDLIARFENIQPGDVLKNANGNGYNSRPNYPAPKPRPAARPKQLGEFVCDYVYENALGQPSYRVNRYEPKDFRQESWNGSEWVSTMEGVERILYRLPQVMAAKEVWIVEGEKDAENLSLLGFCATTNVGGGGNWKDGYAEALNGKDVVICTDRDDQGAKHQKSVFDSLVSWAKTVKIVNVPKPHKDVSDLIEADAGAKALLTKLRDEAVAHIQGITLPIYSMAEMERGYIEHVKNLETDSFSLGRWMPSLGRLRSLCPGELVMFVGNTGIGKTALLCSLAMATRSLPVVMFQLELPPELVFERMLASKCKSKCVDIERAYAVNDVAGKGMLDDHFGNIQICCESGLSLDRIEQIVTRAELKMGHKPKMVLIDYVQLVEGKGENRRDKFSTIAEGMKTLAKRTRTIVVIASQISRPADEKNPEVGLHDAKETGSLENSCGMMFGAWRNPQNPNLMHLKIQKSTKGGAGLELLCNYDGERMIITERGVVDHNANPSPIDDSDVPENKNPHND